MTHIATASYCYDLRGSDYDPGEPVCVEEQVVVNHAGSVLLTEPLELAEDGRLNLTEEEGLNFVGGFSTLTQFLQEQRKDRHTEEVEALYSYFYNVDFLNYFP